MARITIDTLGISELKWTGMGKFNSDDHYIYYRGQEPLRRNGVALIVNKRVWNAVAGCNLKNDRMISVCSQGKPFNITVIQAYALTSNAEEAEDEWFYEDLPDILELIPPKRCPFHYRGLECKSRKSRDTWSNGQVSFWNTKWSRAKFCEYTGNFPQLLQCRRPGFNSWVGKIPWRRKCHPFQFLTGESHG